MIRRKLIRQIFPPYLYVLVLSLVGVIWYASGSFRDFYLNQTALNLESRARLLEQEVISYLSPLQADELDGLLKMLGRSSGIRLTVILPSGKVAADSEENPSQMESHSTRREFMTVKKGEVGKAIRYSRTLEQYMVYVAVPLVHENKLIGVLRTSVSISSLDRQLAGLWTQLAAAGILILILSAGVGLWIARRISRPIKIMEAGALRFARGSLEKMPVPETEELAALAEAMNAMAGELDARIQTIVRQRNELETLLSSMVQGVMAIDADERIIRMNPAAGKMFEVDPQAIQGRAIQEVSRNPGLQKFIAKSLSKGEAFIDDIPFYNGEERIFSVRNSPMHDSRNQKMTGTLVVIDDVTKLRRLENMRKEFVANVSHEIKTPLTTIKGFVETLYNEVYAGNERPDNEKFTRFLGIILKHVDRLNAIIDDLLALSRIERDREVDSIALTRGDLKDVVLSAIAIIRTKADDKKIQIRFETEKESLPVLLNRTLLEQAIVNILENAVKYSHENSHIEIESTSTDSNIQIRFIDHGIGIPREHLPRLFERFYRVDKARSRKMGGTGLGLAIVKHIIQAHNGTVSAESPPGGGSIFTVTLPRLPN